MLRQIKNRGQSAVEYAFLIIVVLGAAIAIQTYFKRGLQGRWKESADQFGDQYDPRTASGRIRHTFSTNQLTIINVVPAGEILETTRTDQTNSIERTTGTMSVGQFAP